MKKCAEKGCTEAGQYRYQKKWFCPLHASNLTHLYQLPDPRCPDAIPCPVVDGETGELIPRGIYPNIDYS